MDNKRAVIDKIKDRRSKLQEIQNKKSIGDEVSLKKDAVVESAKELGGKVKGYLKKGITPRKKAFISKPLLNKDETIKSVKKFGGKIKRYLERNAMPVLVAAIMLIPSKGGTAIAKDTETQKSRVEVNKVNKIDLAKSDSVVNAVVNADMDAFIDKLYQEHEKIIKVPQGRRKAKFGGINYCLNRVTHSLMTTTKENNIAYLNDMLKNMTNPNACERFVEYIAERYPDCITNSGAKERRNEIDFSMLKKGDILIQYVGKATNTTSGNHATTVVKEYHNDKGEKVAVKILSFNRDVERIYELPGKDFSTAIDVSDEERKKIDSKVIKFKDGEDSELKGRVVDLEGIMKKDYLEQITLIAENSNLSESEKEQQIANYSKSNLERVGASAQIQIADGKSISFEDALKVKDSVKGPDASIISKVHDRSRG